MISWPTIDLSLSKATLGERRNFRGKQKIHVVKDAESMYDIAQTYGLCLDRLYKKNKMGNGMQPAIGTSIVIRGKAKKRPKLRRDEVIIPPKPILIETRDSVKVKTKIVTL